MQTLWLLERVTTLLGRLHGHDAVGLGKPLGSSLLNGLAVVGAGAVLHPIRVPWAKWRRPWASARSRCSGC